MARPDGAHRVVVVGLLAALLLLALVPLEWDPCLAGGCDLIPLVNPGGGFHPFFSSLTWVDCTKTTPKRLYRRRAPEKTVLYRALAQHFETFFLVYEELREDFQLHENHRPRHGLPVPRLRHFGIRFRQSSVHGLWLRVRRGPQLQGKVSVPELP